MLTLQSGLIHEEAHGSRVYSGIVTVGNVMYLRFTIFLISDDQCYLTRLLREVDFVTNAHNYIMYVLTIFT